MLSLRKLEKVAGSLSLVEQPVPTPDPGEVLLKVAACGVCGSDVHVYNQDPGFEFVAVPTTLGHEFGGTIAALGPNTSGWKVGQRAVVLGTQFCGECINCRRGQEHLCLNRRVPGLHHDGGMAEYAVVKTRHLVPLPDALDLRHAGMIEPLAVAEHCAADRTPIHPGDLVVVTGPGPIGIFAAVIAQLRGARVVVVGTDADRAGRLSTAYALGFETAVVGDKSLEAQLPRKADALIEASGAAQALAGSFDVLRRGGHLSVVGIYSQPVSWLMTAAVREEFTISCSYGSTYANYLRCIELLTAGKIPVEAVTRQYALSDGPCAFADVISKKELKPLLLP